MKLARRLLDRFRRRRSSTVAATTIAPTLLCEACGRQPGGCLVQSEKYEGETVQLCEWCYMRWRRLNETWAIPKTRRRKKR